MEPRAHFHLECLLTCNGNCPVFSLTWRKVHIRLTYQLVIVDLSRFLVALYLPIIFFGNQWCDALELLVKIVWTRYTLWRPVSTFSHHKLSKFTTVDAGYKNIVGNCIQCPNIWHVLITAMSDTMDIKVVF